MFGIDDAIAIPAIVSAAGAGLNFLGGQEANQTRQDLANQANTFSAQQYATRYQTTVKDLEAAGLNPMLAYGQGAGSAPSAVSPPQVQNKFEGAQDFANKAIGAANQHAEIKLKNEQVNATSAQAEASQTQALANLAGALNQLNQSKKPDQEIENMKHQIGVMAAQITAYQSQAGLNSALAAESAKRQSNEMTQDPWWFNKLKQNAEKMKSHFDNRIKGTFMDFDSPIYKGKNVTIKGN